MSLAILAITLVISFNTHGGDGAECPSASESPTVSFYLSNSVVITKLLTISSAYLSPGELKSPEPKKLSAIGLVFKWPSLCPAEAGSPEIFTHGSKEHQLVTFYATVVPHVKSVWDKEAPYLEKNGTANSGLQKYRYQPHLPVAKHDRTRRYYYDGSDGEFKFPAIITCGAYCDLYTENENNIAFKVIFAEGSLGDWKEIIRRYNAFANRMIADRQ